MQKAGPGAPFSGIQGPCCPIGRVGERQEWLEIRGLGDRPRRPLEVVGEEHDPPHFAPDLHEGRHAAEGPAVRAVLRGRPPAGGSHGLVGEHLRGAAPRVAFGRVVFIAGIRYPKQAPVGNLHVPSNEFNGTLLEWNQNNAVQVPTETPMPDYHNIAVPEE